MTITFRCAERGKPAPPGAGYIHMNRDAAHRYRMARRVLRAIGEAGGNAKWSGATGLRKSRFNAGERPAADSALELLVERGTIVKAQLDQSWYAGVADSWNVEAYRARRGSTS
jgi:hypothetical protein